MNKSQLQLDFTKFTHILKHTYHVKKKKHKKQSIAQQNLKKNSYPYTPSFLYQHHFDGYIEMSEEDATLFGEMDPDPAPDHWSDNAGLTQPVRTAPTARNVIPDKVTSIGPVPTSEPDDSRRVDASATLVKARIQSL